MIGSTVRLGLDASAVMAGFRKVSAGFQTLGRRMASVGRTMLAPFVKLMAIAAPLIGLGAGFVLVKNASKQAADLELMGTAFETLLGGVDAAATRIKELERFSVLTPFEPAEVIRASKLLQTLGGDVMATGDGLRMVGDAASVAGQPLEEVALHIGRIFNALTSGTSAGESINRMQELGLMSGTLKLKFQALAEAQKKGTQAALTNEQALALLQGTFGKTAGAMERLSQTFAGKMSTLKGNWDALLATFGKGVNEGFGVFVDKLNTALPGLTEEFRKAGEALGGWIKALYGAFEQGQLGDLIWSTLKWAGAKFIEFIVAGFKFAVQETIEALSRTDAGKALGIKSANEAKTQVIVDPAFGFPVGTRTVPGEGTKTLGEMINSTRGMYGSEEAANTLQSIMRVARWEEQEKWLREIKYTDAQILEVQRQQLQQLKTGTPFR